MNRSGLIANWILTHLECKKKFVYLFYLQMSISLLRLSIFISQHLQMILLLTRFVKSPLSFQTRFHWRTKAIHFTVYQRFPSCFCYTVTNGTKGRHMQRFPAVSCVKTNHKSRAVWTIVKSAKKIICCNIVYRINGAHCPAVGEFPCKLHKQERVNIYSYPQISSKLWRTLIPSLSWQFLYPVKCLCNSGQGRINLFVILRMNSYEECLLFETR